MLAFSLKYWTSALSLIAHRHADLLGLIVAVIGTIVLVVLTVCIWRLVRSRSRWSVRSRASVDRRLRRLEHKTSRANAEIQRDAEAIRQDLFRDVSRLRNQ